MFINVCIGCMSHVCRVGIAHHLLLLGLREYYVFKVGCVAR